MEKILSIDDQFLGELSCIRWFSRLFNLANDLIFEHHYRIFLLLVKRIIGNFLEC
jgi:hypothetical protein